MEEMPRQIMSEALTGFDDDTAARFFSAQKVEGFGSVSEFPGVTAGLLARGWSPENVRKVLGGNWLRFYEEAWTPEVPSSERKLAGAGRRRSDPDYALTPANF
jgi:hypothetical protein